MNNINLDGRFAVVTGGASGMGFATAQRLLESGAIVEIWGRSEPKMEDAVEQLALHGQVTWRKVDVSDVGAVKRAAQLILNQYKSVDILVNAAGATPEVRPMTELTLEGWREIMAVNLDSVFYCCQAFVPTMCDRRQGRIINFTSMAGKEGNPFQSAYSAAKAGVIGFTKSVAKEIATTGVTVNAIAPTLFATPMLESARNENPEAVKIALEKIPMKRIGMPHEAAALAVWIASDQCSFTTGFTFDLSGGRATY